MQNESMASQSLGAPSAQGFVPAQEITSDGARIDGSRIKFWAKKSEAIRAAKALGFPASSVQEVYTRFQIGYSIAGNGGFLART